MNSKHDRPARSVELRRQAEARLDNRKRPPAAAELQSEADLRRLQHELEVHQIELEMQNEALRQAQVATEEALERSIDLFDYAPTGYFNLGTDGSILAVNLAGARLAGVERSRLLKRRFVTLVSAADRDDVSTFLERVLRRGGRASVEVEFSSPGTVPIQIQLEAAVSPDGKEVRVTAFDVTERHETETERRVLSAKLQQALDSLKRLSGLLPICSVCKKVRDAEGGWSELEHYIADHAEIIFTHGICPECFPEALEDVRKSKVTKS